MSKKQRKSKRNRMHVLVPTALAAILGSDADAGEPEDTEDPMTEIRDSHRDADARPGLVGVLPAALLWMSGLERTEVIASWAMSPSPGARLAIARALGGAPPSVGLLSAIEVLATDDQPEVRMAAADAAWERRHEDPQRMTALLRRLLNDPHAGVSERAQMALGRHS
jgi:hypothetical protein